MGQADQIGQVIQRIEKSREGYMDTKIPEEGIVYMKAAINRAKQEKKRIRHKCYKRIGAGIAVVFVMMCLIAKCGRAYAKVVTVQPQLYEDYYE